MLILMAGAGFTPAEAYQKFGEELTAASVEYQAHTYEGAPHSFFDLTFADHREASVDAWRRMLDFIDQHRGQS